MVLAACAVASMNGCVGLAPPPRAKTQTVMQAQLYKPPADRILTSTLLDFDGPHDSTFVDAPIIRLAADPQRPGNHVLVADAATRLNLASLVLGRNFGATWDVVGVRLWSDVPATCDVVLRQGDGPKRSARATLAPHAWTAVWIDVSRPEATSMPTSMMAAAPDVLQMSFDVVGARSSLLIDDVVLAQSHTVICETQVPKTNEHFVIARTGLTWGASMNGQPFFELPAAPFVPGGYHLTESGPTRGVFENDAGSTIALDRTGRLIENGVAKLDPRVLKVAKAIAENASPAKIEIVGDEGRIERTLPGDRDNDGYDERRGCYTVHATAGRAAVRFTRQGATVKWPVLEVLDLPPGTPSVWLDGEIVPWAVRADDGRVIVELPIELQTPVEVQVRVK